jgi:hypothetical protein
MAEKKSSATNAIHVVAIDAGQKDARLQDPEAVRKAVIEAVRAIPAANLKKLKNGRITVLV